MVKNLNQRIFFNDSNGGVVMKMTKLSLTALLLLVFGFTGRPVFADGLMAGVSVVNITPPKGFKHSAIGIGGGIDVNFGVHDSTYARILALTDGTERMTIITLDLLGFFPDRVKSLLPQELQNTVFCATHDHMGAATVSFTPPDFVYRTDYLTEIEDTIAASIIETHKHLTPVTVGAATGTFDESYNKLGGGLGLYLCGQQNPDRIRFEPVDQEVGVIRFDKQDGKPLAILVNYASHPVIAWICTRVTAEFPGFMENYLEEAIGDGVVGFYLQGACGDIQPFDACAESYDKAREFGEKLAMTVLEINSSLQTEEPPESELVFISDIIPLGGRNDLKYRPDTTGMTFNAELTVTIINKNIAFVSGPGEFFVDFQLDLKEKSPIDHTFFLGYANGYYGYFQTLQAIEENWNGGYSHNLWVEIGAGEKIIEKGLYHIYDLLSITPGVSESEPAAFSLRPNYPNPFNPQTTINYQLHRKGMVTLSIYDVHGRQVTTMVNEMKAPGNYSVTWNSEGFASGLYFCRIELDRSNAMTQKMLLMK